MATEIDSLQVKVTANSKAATESLKSLAMALNKVKTALTGMKDGVSISARLSKSFSEMNSSMNSISTGGIKKLNQLTDALNGYSSAVKNLKGAGGVSTSIRNVEKALSVGSGMKVRSETAVSGEEVSEAEVKQNTKDWLNWYRAMEQESKKGGDKPDKSPSAATKHVKHQMRLVGDFVKSIGRIAVYRAIRAAIKAVSEAFSEGLKNAYYFSKQIGDFTRLAETMDRLKSITAQMKNQLGSLAGELIQAIMPALEWIVAKVREIADFVSEVLAALNGDDFYLRATYVQQSWDKATDAAEKYKHQLLGIDELNNLSKKNDKANDPVADATKAFEKVAVGDKAKGVANAIEPIIRWIKNAIKKVMKWLSNPIGLIVTGAILTFFTHHKLLGIGMMAVGAYKIYKKAKEDPDGLYRQIQGFMEKYRWLFMAGAIGLTVAGVALMFTGHYALGIGCLLAGGLLAGFTIAMAGSALLDDVRGFMQEYRWLFIAGAIGLTVAGVALLFTHHYALGIGCLIGGGLLAGFTIAMAGSQMLEDIKGFMQEYRWLFIADSVALTAIGAALLFTQHYALGIGCILGGIALGASAVAVSWEQLYTDIQTAFQKFAPLFAAVGVGSMVAGAILLFTGHIGLGLGLLIGGSFITAETIAVNWDSIYDSLVKAYEKIANWWNNTVVKGVKKAVGWLEKYTKIDFNQDGYLGYVETIEKGGLGNGLITTRMYDSDEASARKKYNATKDKVGSTFNKVRKDAIGGIEKRGTLFLAGEQGAEFIGNMGSTSAVANTGQMTDAIYKAAYMGMSRALKENGNNGMNGFVPATTDDLFIAMRKKANNYNKLTGNPAFA